MCDASFATRFGLNQQIYLIEICFLCSCKCKTNMPTMYRVKYSAKNTYSLHAAFANFSSLTFEQPQLPVMRVLVTFVLTFFSPHIGHSLDTYSHSLSSLDSPSISESLSLDSSDESNEEGHEEEVAVDFA